jgi:hypothetical protein
MAPENSARQSQGKADGVTPAGFFCPSEHQMTKVEQIVDEYVQLGNRQALEYLLTHRRKLAGDLKSRAVSGSRLPIDEIDHLITAIKACLDRLAAKLDPIAGALGE